MKIVLDFAEVLVHWPLFAKGVAVTTGLTVVSAALGVVLGVACAWARQEGAAWLRGIVSCYVEAIRNTPFIVQLFFLYFGLPSLGFKLSPIEASVLAMVINLGAYSAEIVRAGLASTPKGQVQAGLSLGLDRWQLFTRIILPPAFQRVWPALVSQIIIVMLGSAVCGQISTEELSFAANLVQSRNFRSFESFALATGLYLVLAILLRAALNWLGERWLFGRSHLLGH